MSFNTVELDSEHVSRMLIKFSVPAILALMIQSLYNLIDTIYVGHGVGSVGIAALTIFFPLQILVVSIANLISIGGGALLSISLGKRNLKYANKIAGNVLLTIICSGVILTVVCLIYIKPILTVFGSTEAMYPYVRDYAVVAFSGITFTLLLQGLYNLLRAEGKLKLIMKTTIASVLLNVVLNPLFLFTFDMGMAGVSIATVISQIVVLIVISVYYLRDKAIIKIRLRYFVPDFKIIYKSCLLGTSSMLRMGGSAALNVLINKIAGHYGGIDGIASFGLAYRLIIFMFMPILGFIQGAQPLFGFNYGAGKIYRMKKILNCSFVITISISCIMFVLVLLFSEMIMPIFTNNLNIILDTPKYLKWLTLALPLIAYQAIISGYLQAVGRVLASNVVTVIRQFIFFPPAIIVLSYFYQMKGLSASYIVSNLITFIILYIWMRKEIRENLSSEDENRRKPLPTSL